MQKDLFGNEIEVEQSKCLKTLLEFDKETLDDRRKRCEFLFKIFPDERIWISSDESYFIWMEIKIAFITGCFISTILLAQSYIERKFQGDYHMIFDTKRSKMTLDQILKEMRKDKSVDNYWINRIDNIRKKRNPLVHFKEVMSKKERL